MIAAPLRCALELEEGDRLVARQEADRLVLEKPDRVKKRLKARFAQVPVERALVNELIAERREQFCLEDSRRESVRWLWCLMPQPYWLISVKNMAPLWCIGCRLMRS